MIYLAVDSADSPKINKGAQDGSLGDLHLQILYIKIMFYFFVGKTVTLTVN